MRESACTTQEKDDSQIYYATSAELIAWPGPAVSARAAMPAQPEPCAIREKECRARAIASRIWDTHRAYLHLLGLRWLGGDRVEVEDAVADVIYKASLFLATDNTVVHERAWLTRMLHNRCMDRHRRRQTTISLDTGPAALRDQIEGRADYVPSAEDRMLSSELGAMIDRALAELPKTLRGPAEMRMLREESYSAISRAYRISEANARKRVQLARELLRQRLAAYVEPDRRAPAARPDALHKRGGGAS